MRKSANKPRIRATAASNKIGSRLKQRPDVAGKGGRGGVVNHLITGELRKSGVGFDPYRPLRRGFQSPTNLYEVFDALTTICPNNIRTVSGQRFCRLLGRQTRQCSIVILAGVEYAGHLPI